MGLNAAELAPQYRRLVEGCHPYLLSWRGNWDHVDLAPFGFQIAPERLFCPTRLSSSDVVDYLHRLDSFSFGPQEMLMPRWVLFDCGEFPGIVFGFGRYARDLSPAVREAYKAERDDSFVPLSMWVAIPSVEPGGWFGHNLSSVNVITKDDTFAGIGTLSKAFGIKLARIRHQYGATQWKSTSIGLHLTYGEMRLQSAYTPAHTHVETFSYLIEVDDERLAECLKAGWKRPHLDTDITFTADDPVAIRTLHERIECGEDLRLVRVEGRGDSQRMHIRKVG